MMIEINYMDSISASVISRVLSNKGFQISRGAVQRYRGLYES
jgi:DNA-directed RNA polymerase specialized sigma54-like protein